MTKNSISNSKFTGVILAAFAVIICAFFYLNERISFSGEIGTSLVIIGLFLSSKKSR